VGDGLVDHGGDMVGTGEVKVNEPAQRGSRKGGAKLPSGSCLQPLVAPLSFRAVGMVATICTSR
jgi:hypothetical protein